MYVHFFYTEVYVIYLTLTIFVYVLWKSCNGVLRNVMGSVTVYRGRLVWCVWDMTCLLMCVFVSTIAW